MAFELQSVVPWGRNLDEYISMFDLGEADLDKAIIGFGDGPASFNAEMTRRGKRVVSVDPVYRFSAAELRTRIDETASVVLDQARQNMNNFVWTAIKDVDELARVRLGAMERFLEDFEAGKREGRYVDHPLPERLPFDDASFDLGLSSHFLLLYTQLGLDFHIASITEMLRVCREIRIFPLLDLDAKRSGLLDDVMGHFRNRYRVEVMKVGYEFQRGGNEMLVIK